MYGARHDDVQKQQRRKMSRPYVKVKLGKKPFSYRRGEEAERAATAACWLAPAAAAPSARPRPAPRRPPRVAVARPGIKSHRDGTGRKVGGEERRGGEGRGSEREVLNPLNKGG